MSYQDINNVKDCWVRLNIYQQSLLQFCEENLQRSFIEESVLALLLQYTSMIVI